MENTKFKLLLTDNILFEGEVLYRIEALRDINRHVKKGDKGGYVQNENNLSFEGESWLYDDSKVLGDGFVYDRAEVRNTSIIRSGSYVCGYTYVDGASDITNDIRQPLASGSVRDGKIADVGDVVVVSNLGIWYWELTAYKSERGILVRHGNHFETLDDFTDMIKQNKLDVIKNPKAYLAAIEYIKAQIGI